MRFNSQILGIAILLSVCTTTGFAEDTKKQNGDTQQPTKKAQTNKDKPATSALGLAEGTEKQNGNTQQPTKKAQTNKDKPATPAPYKKAGKEPNKNSK